MANDAVMKALSGVKGSKEQLQLLAALLTAGEDLDPVKGRTATTSTHEKPNIILPSGMSKLAASAELKRQHEEEETIIELRHDFMRWDYNDALVCTMRQMKETFGWVNAQVIKTFFGDILPLEMQFPVGLTDEGVVITEEGFLNQFGISAWSNAKGNISVSKAGVVVLTVECKKKHKEQVTTFFNDCERRLSTASIYKGKSVVFDKNENSQFGFTFYHNQPNQHIFLNEDEELMVKNLVIAPMADRGNRKMLFFGPFGTGKTESAMRVGFEANSREITFIYCKNTENFAKCLESAVQYAPAVIFAEDVDQIGSGEDRDAKMNSLLNTLDGVQTKGKAVSVIFTTNHHKRISPALRRPGRIDVIVEFKVCDADTIKKIYLDRFQAQPSGSQLDYDMLVAKTPVAQGAVIAEICTRSLDTAKAISDGHLSDDIVLTAIASMKVQLDFMREDPEEETTKLPAALKLVLEAAGAVTAEKLATAYDEQGYSEIAQHLRS